MSTASDTAWTKFREINQNIHGIVVWDSWPTASEVFKNEETLGNGQSTTRIWDDMDGLVAGSGIDNLISLLRAKGTFHVSTKGGTNLKSETRMNYSVFNNVKNLRLFNVNGQREAHDNITQVDFLPDGIVLKASWKLLSQTDDENKFHFTIALTRKQKHRFDTLKLGLIALHIATADRPNWFWATFEHVSNLDSERVRFLRQAYPIPNDLIGTVWENYVLIGTQTDFVGKDRSTPTRLANSILEGFMDTTTSSCITCHKLAAIGPIENGKPLRLNMGEVRNDKFFGYLGDIEPERFTRGNEEYIRTGFLWSVRRVDAWATPRLNSKNRTK